MKITGGSGDDKVYGGYSTDGKSYLYGNSGKDIIRSDWFRSKDGDATNDGEDEYLFGDFKYGTDALDKDLWGDADIIYGGYGDDDADSYIYGGDGDDQIHPGDYWDDSYVYGGNGADTIYVPELTGGDLIIRGGDGDDVWVVDSYGETSSSNQNTDNYFFGGAGNDVIRGSHFLESDEFLYGGAGEDKIYGGDAGELGHLLVGGSGDDWIEAGSNMTTGGASTTFYVYGDGFDYDNGRGVSKQGYNDNEATYGNADDWRTDNGDDVIYGGSNNMGSHYFVGGYGNDKIITGSNNEGSGASI